jgi:hypothetical protein
MSQPWRGALSSVLPASGRVLLPGSLGPPVVLPAAGVAAGVVIAAGVVGVVGVVTGVAGVVVGA